MWDSIKFLCILGLLLFGMYKCETSEGTQKLRKEQAAQELANRTPHVIREADGCKVYAFKSDGSYHYFTRCGNVVTTDRTYTQSCGKNCTKKMTETIITEGNK